MEKSPRKNIGIIVNFLCLPIAIKAAIRYNRTDNRLVMPICKNSGFFMHKQRKEGTYGILADNMVPLKQHPACGYCGYFDRCIFDI
jgi:hypothetical protein